MLKIAIGQMKIVPGAIEENYSTICKMVEKATTMGADLIVFPEMCVGGYLLGDRYYDESFCNTLQEYNEKIRNLSTNIGIIWGNLYLGEVDGIKRGRDGRRARYNAAFFAYQGEWVNHENSSRYAGLYIKHLNPDYRIFEDSRYFLSADELQNYEEFSMESIHTPFLFKEHRIGLEICEDMWSHDYRIDLTQKYAKMGVKYIINLSSSPWTTGKEEARNKQIREHAKKSTLPIFIYVNGVGCQNNGKNVLMFDGGSTVYGHFGDPILHCNDAFISELKLYEGKSEPIVYCKNKLLEALTYGIKEFDSQMFPHQPKWIIGLSGGLDSSISAALLVRALGSERVLGYNLATNYNSSDTMDNATKLAKALQIPLRNGNIEALVNATKEVVMNEYGYEENEISSFTMENVQARIRGHLLSTFAAIHHGVICNNGNKVEAALGYCTLYGDTIGALAVLGDLLKTDLFELAKQINEESHIEVIPTRLLPNLSGNHIDWEMMPSAELKDKQTDPMKWFYHDALIDYLTTFPNYGVDNFVRAYESGELQKDSRFGPWLSYYGLDVNPAAFFEDLEWVLHQMQISIFKRIQMPPILTVSRGAFGLDFRESQMRVAYSEEYQKIRERLTGKRATAV